MAKELIISANVHEKKVCVLEDGVVTEFYVERRDENQGVVGNLYKGRVMKVLPGMQSAFVDIGLDRDAFLYVSDFAEFMEDEDDIDFKEMSQPRQDDRPARGGRRRDERVQEAKKPSPEQVKEGALDEPAEIENMVEQLAEIADESLIPPPATDEELEGEARELKTDETGEVEIEEAEVTPVDADEEETPEEEAKAKKTTKGRTRHTKTAKAEEKAEEKPKRTRSRKKAAEEDTETAKPKTTRRTRKKTEDTDDEATAKKTTTAKRKTAAKKPATKRTSRKRSTKASAEKEEKEKEGKPEPESQFERVTDDDIMEEAGDMLKDAMVEEKIMDQIHVTEYKTSPPNLEPEPEWRVGSFLSTINQDSSFQRVVDETVETSSQEETNSYGEDEEDEIETSPFRHISDAIPEDIFDLAMAESSEEMGEETNEEDNEAEVRSHRGRADFAVRRGGRRRRPRRDAKSDSADESGEKSEPDAKAEEKPTAKEDSKKAEAQKEDSKKADAQKPSSPSRSRPPRRQDSRHSRRPDTRSRQEQPQGRKPERGGTTISDLLREGQEILVQIAKEPIAKKGARITSHIALPGRYLVYMPTVNHVGVSRKINSEGERIRLKKIVTMLRDREGATGGFIARTACGGHSEQELSDDMRYLLRTWADLRQKADKNKAPTLVHRDLDLVQRIMRDQLSEEFTAIRIDSEIEYARIVEFINRIQPKLVKRVKLYTGTQPILERYGIQPEIDKAVKSRVWLKSGGYIVINQTEALVAIDVNTGKFVGKSDKLEDTITRTNMEAAKEIVRQVRLRDLGGIIVIDFIDMDERKNRQRVMTALQYELQNDRAPSKILSINDFGLVAITRKRVKQSLERTLCTPCPYCQGGGMVKSAQTMCFEILEQAKAITKEVSGSSDIMLRVSPDVAEAFRTSERAVLEEIEAYFGMPVTIESDPNLHQEQYDFAIV